MEDFFEQLLNSILADSIGTQWIASTLRFGAPLDIVQTLLRAFSHFAMLLTVVYFLLDMNKRFIAEAQNFNIKSVFAPFIKLAAAVAVLHYVPTLADSLTRLHNALISLVSNSVSVSSESIQLQEATWNHLRQVGGGFFLYIFIGFFALFIYIAQIAIMIVLMYKVLGFKIEYWFKMCTGTIACADVYSGTNSNAVKWIKSLIALSIYGMAFMILPQIASELASDVMSAALPDFHIFGAGNSGTVPRVRTGESWFSQAINTALVGIDEPMTLYFALIKVMIARLLAPITVVGSLSAAKQAAKEALG